MASFASPFVYDPAVEEDEAEEVTATEAGSLGSALGGATARMDQLAAPDRDEAAGVEEEEEEEDDADLSMDIQSRVMSHMTPAMPAPQASGAAPGAPAVPLPAPRLLNRHRRHRGARSSARYRVARHVHTNVMSVDLATLENAVDEPAMAPIRCGNPRCRAFLSAVSTIYDTAGNIARQPAAHENPAEDDSEGEDPAARAAQAAPAAPVGSDEAATGSDEAATGSDEAATGSDEAAGGSDQTASAGSGGRLMWACEFCDFRNELPEDFEPSSVPRTAAVEWVVSRPTVEPGTGAGPAKQDDGSFLLFVCDTSGSMCVTKEVAGRVQLRGDRTAELAGLRQAGDGDQFMPGQRRDVTYVSRLQALQAAVSDQIRGLATQQPSLRVGLVSFAGEVVFAGDGSADEQRFSGEQLDNYESLLAAGRGLVLNGKVSDSADALEQKVFGLSESGPTALGPAMVLALGLASQRAGSKIVLVTDGLANVGVGSLELEEDSPQGQVAEEGVEGVIDPRQAFYQRLGALAADNGVVVDVVGIEGEGANLEYVGSVSEQSGGEVHTVDPMKLADNFSSMLANAVIATNVTVGARTNDAVHFHDLAQDIVGRQARSAAVPDPAAATGGAGGGPEGDAASAASQFAILDPPPTPSHFVRRVGNASADTEVSLEFAFQRQSARRTPAAPTSSQQSDQQRAAASKFLPFQVQIAFKKLDGTEMLRVLSLEQRVTRRRERALRSLNMPVLASHARTQAAALAQEGQYEASRMTSAMYGELMATNAATPAQQQTLQLWSADMAAMDDTLQGEIMEERSAGLRMARASAAHSRSVRTQRRTRNDAFSSQVRNFKAKGAARRYRMASTPVDSQAAPAGQPPRHGGRGVAAGGRRRGVPPRAVPPPVAEGPPAARGGIMGMLGSLFGGSSQAQQVAQPEAAEDRDVVVATNEPEAEDEDLFPAGGPVAE